MRPGVRIADQQRVSAELEEVVLPTHPLYPKQLLPDPCQRRLDLPLRGFVIPPRIRLLIRCRQCAPIQLPVRRQRQRLQHHKRTRHHVFRQNPFQVLPQRFHLQTTSLARFGRINGGDIRIPSSDIRHQALLAGQVLPRQHHCIPHAFVSRQLRLDCNPIPRLGSRPIRRIPSDVRGCKPPDRP
jgi:hypothetical protein